MTIVKCGTWAAALALSFSLMWGTAARAQNGGNPLSPDTLRLANGMQVIVVPDHRAPVVTHMVWYQAGAADEPPGKSGIAHFLEHLMFRGTSTVAPGDFSKIVAKNGGEDNAFTTQDYTAYYQRVAVDRLPLVMEMEADRMRNLVLTDEIVATERNVILEERRMRTDNNPAALLGEQMGAAQYLNHPYHNPTIGWEHEMEGLTREDALSFYKRFYEPNNALLIVAGDVTLEQVKSLAEKYYGPIPAGEPIVRKRPQEPPQIAARRVILEDGRAQLPSFSRSYLAPSYGTDTDEEAEAIDVMIDVLGGSETSRLYRALVVDQKIATSAGAYYTSAGLDSATIGIYASPVPGVELEALEAAIDEVIDDFKTSGVSEDEITRSKTGLKAAAIYARDNQQSMARIFGVSLTTGETIEDIVKWPERIEAVPAAQVKDVAVKYLTAERSVTGYLKPVPGKTPMGDADGAATGPVEPMGPIH